MANQAKQRVNRWPVTVQRGHHQQRQREDRDRALAEARDNDIRREVIALRDGDCGGYQIQPVIEDENGE